MDLEAVNTCLEHALEAFKMEFPPEEPKSIVVLKTKSGYKVEMQGKLVLHTTCRLTAYYDSSGAVMNCNTNKRGE